MQMWTFMSTKLNLVWIFLTIFQDYWNAYYYFPRLLEHTVLFSKIIGTHRKHWLSYVGQVSIFLLSLFSNSYLVFWILLTPPNRHADMPRILKKKKDQRILWLLWLTFLHFPACDDLLLFNVDFSLASLF